MTKKDYQQPTMKVVKLQHRQHLLQASGPVMLRGNQGATPEEDTYFELE